MKLIFKTPARGWHESLILGNGRIGGAVYGGTKRERISLNEDTLWSGYPVQTQKEMPKGYLEKIRELTMAKDYVRAMEETESVLGESEDTQMYVPFGDLCLEFDGDEEITEYHRELDLETAEVIVRYKNFGSRIEKRCLVSEPDQVLIYRIKSEQPLTVRIWTEGGYLIGSRLDDGVLKSFGRCPGRNSFTKSEAGGEKAVPTLSERPKEMGMRYEGWGKAVTKDGWMEEMPEGMVVRNARETSGGIPALLQPGVAGAKGRGFRGAGSEKAAFGCAGRKGRSGIIGPAFSLWQIPADCGLQAGDPGGESAGNLE